MAQEEAHRTATVDTGVNSPTPPVASDNSTHHHGYYPGHRNSIWISSIIIGIATFIILVVIATILTFFMNTFRSGYTSIYDPPHGVYPMRGEYYQNIPAGQVRVSGVVTAVNGSTLTVAGNGMRTEVTVDDTTAYIGAKQPATINDSITVVGTAGSDGTITAATVRLSRQ